MEDRKYFVVFAIGFIAGLGWGFAIWQFLHQTGWLYLLYRLPAAC
jgi:hypothetical protein